MVVGAIVLSSFLILTGCGNSSKLINQAKNNIKQAEETIEKAKDDVKVTKDNSSSAKSISVGQTVTTKNFEFTLWIINENQLLLNQLRIHDSQT